MSGPPVVDLWYDFASTYSYLSVMRIGAVAEAAGIGVRWRPFLLGPIFRAQGWESSPFNLYPAKGRYMWRDMERLCADACLPLKRPPQFPANSLLAARVGLVAETDGFIADFTRGAFDAAFGEGRDIADPAVVAAVLTGLGHDADAVLERARHDANKAALKDRTAEAQARDIFGAPTFITADGEVFWGNDRLEHAFAWASLHREPVDGAH